MCAARHDPGTFEFVARMGRLTMETDDDEEESKNRVPLSFITPALPPRQEKPGRSQRACKSVDLPGEFQNGEDTHKQVKRQSSKESLGRIYESRKKVSQEHARKQEALTSPTSSQRTSKGPTT
ncbi:uncharacterized protein [Haliotis asinina]|uniref:uncharacterized protein n=1 Tax=Haliotis asinina TaxID=109174 RepID=UPI003531F75E